MQLTELEKEAIELANTKDWYPWVFESVDNGILCSGAVCPLITRGKNKGRPNYRKADMSTYKTVVILKAQP